MRRRDATSAEKAIETLWPRHGRDVETIGALLATNALLVALALSIGRQLFVDQLAGTAFAAASRAFFDTLIAYLQRAQHVLLGLGLVLVVVGWFAGSNKYGTAVRTTVTRGLESTGTRLADGPVAGASRWVADSVGWLRAAVGVRGVVILFWGNNVSSSRFWWSLAVVLVLLALLQVLVGAGRKSWPTGPAPRPETTTRDAGWRTRVHVHRPCHLWALRLGFEPDQ